MEERKKYYIYILRCEDSSLYTGITTNIERRYKEHVEGKGAKYTRAKGVKNIESVFQCTGRKEASRVESYIKKMPKKKKEFYIKHREIFIEKIWSEREIKIKIK